VGVSHRRSGREPLTKPYFARTLADAVRFQCCGCGACCHNWGVAVDEPSRKRIEEHLAAHPHPQWGATIPVEWVNGNPILKLVDGACAYLTEDHLCWLHKEFGPEIKPLICRTYPRRPTVTSEGVFTSLTYSCHTAAGYLASDEDDGRPVHQAAFAYNEATPLFRLCEGIPLDHALFRAIDAALSAMIERSDLTVGARLCAVDAAIARIKSAIMKGDAGDARTILDRASSAERPLPPSPPLSDHLQMIRALFRHRRAYVIPGVPAQETLRKILEVFDAVYAFQDEAARPPSTIRLSRALARHWAPAAPVTEPILARYVARQFWSKYFTSSFGIQNGVRVIAILVAVIRAYATALAAISNSPVTAHHLTAAITDVEREFTHVNAIMEFWKQVLANPNADKEWFVPLLVL
jgi:Fe-S-cluster containining protein